MMKNEQETKEEVAGQKKWPTNARSRREFLKLGSAGLAALAGTAALGGQT